MAVSFAKRMATRYKKITSDATKVNLYIHETCLMIFDHALEHNDPRELHNLFEAMPASYRREKMLDWFTEFTPIRYNKSTGRCGFIQEYNTEARKTPEGKAPFWDREAAEENSWDKLADRDPEVKPFDYKAMMQLLARLPKMVEGKLEKGLVPDEDIASAKAFIDYTSSLHFKRVPSPLGQPVAEPEVQAAKAKRQKKAAPVDA